MNEYQKQVDEYYKALDRGRVFGKYFILASLILSLWIFVSMWGWMLGLIAGIIIGLIFGIFVGGILIRLIFPKVKNDPTSQHTD